MDGNKIYFAASIRGEGEDVELYRDIIKYLGNYGKVLTEHVGDKNLSSQRDDGLTDFQIHDVDIELLGQAQYVVAEVTQASLGTGYELGRIAERNLWVPESEKTNILCLYRPKIDKRLSAMIAGSSGIKNVEYQNLTEARKAIDRFFL